MFNASISIITISMSQEPIDLEEAEQKIRAAVNYSEIEEVSRLITASPIIDHIDLTSKLEQIIIDSKQVYPLELKLNIFQVMSAILLSDHKSRYLKHFTTRIMAFLKRYSVLVSENQLLTQRTIDTLKRLQNGQVFQNAFFSKLQALAHSVLYTGPQEEAASLFKKYTKSFLLSLRDVRKVECTQALYRSYQLRKEEEESVAQIKEEFNLVEHSVESQNVNQARVDQLKAKVENALEKLMLSLQLNNKGMQDLKKIVGRERNMLEVDRDLQTSN